MLIDTDVLIWYMKGNSKALYEIEKNKNFSISVVTYMELVQGMKNKQELNEFRKALKSWNTKIIYISEAVSSKAMFYVEQHYLTQVRHIELQSPGIQAPSQFFRHYKFSIVNRLPRGRSDSPNRW